MSDKLTLEIALGSTKVSQAQLLTIVYKSNIPRFTTDACREEDMEGTELHILLQQSRHGQLDSWLQFYWHRSELVASHHLYSHCRSHRHHCISIALQMCRGLSHWLSSGSSFRLWHVRSVLCCRSSCDFGSNILFLQA